MTEKQKPRGLGVQHLGATSDFSSAVPREVALVEFGRRVQKFMVEKGFTSQADLARKASQFLPEGKSFNRDTISKYIKGITLPRAAHLSALAKALDVAEDELVPKQLSKTTTPETVAVNVSTVDEDTAWLRINQAVPWSTAVKILALLKGEDG